MLTVGQLAKTTASETIFITGAARTGTTMLGKLFQSLADIEYMYEPPTVISLMASINETPENNWRFLFETYQFEDFLLNALAGRHINLNANDESSILRAKTKEDISLRMEKSHRRIDLYERAKSVRVAVKIPDVISQMDQFKSYYTNSTIIILARNLPSIVASVLRMEWFTEDSVQGLSLYWPYRQIDGYNIPFWLPESLIDRFVGASEIERCCLYVIEMYKHAVRDDQYIWINYDQFVKNPGELFHRVRSELDLSAGPLTEGLLKQVAEPSRDRTISLDQVSVDIREQFEALNETLTTKVYF
jgi:hypothetical protein